MYYLLIAVILERFVYNHAKWCKITAKALMCRLAMRDREGREREREKGSRCRCLHDQLIYETVPYFWGKKWNFNGNN